MTKEKDDKIQCSGGLDLESKHPFVYLHVNSEQVTVSNILKRQQIVQVQMFTMAIQ